MEFSHAFANAEVNSGNTVAAGLAAPWLGRITTISQPQSRKWPHHKLGLFFWGGDAGDAYFRVQADFRCIIQLS